MVKTKNTKQIDNGFFVLQINQGGKFTYLCCPQCKPHIDKEYKNLKIETVKEEFFSTEKFKKLNPKVEVPCCSYCKRPFYNLTRNKPIKKNESKNKRWNRILAKYCINQKNLLDKCSKYGKEKAETLFLSDEALWELTQTIQQKCRNFIEKKTKR